MNRVRTIEVFNLCIIARAQQHVVPLGLREFIRDPFVIAHAVMMSALNHERPGIDEPTHLRVVKRIAHVPFPHLVFAGENVRKRMVDADTFPYPP